jgi:protein-glutamine gamma-glutamyltransferase
MAFWNRTKSTPPAIAEPPLPRATLLQLIVAVLPILGPHVSHLPIWCSVFAGALILWRVWIVWKQGALPRRGLLILLVVLALAATLWTHRTIFGRDPGVTLLTVFMSLKLMETRTKRDAALVVYLGYFLILTNFFYSQSIATAAVMIAAIWLVTMTLVNLNRDAAPLPIRAQAKLAGWMLAGAFPMMLVLFVLFPRVQGPLWGMPADAHAGKTGLSDSMSPGTISNLILDGGIAFRVQFTGEEPTPRDMYWRGPVLTLYDGRTWRPLPATGQRVPEFQSDGRLLKYTVTLEPQNKPWLMALEHPVRTGLPAQSQVESRLMSDMMLLASKPVTARLRYDITSRVGATPIVAESNPELALARQLPGAGNLRTRALVQQWREELGNAPGADAAFVQRALQYFRDNKFTYTLQPPLLGPDPIDQLLFETKQGFCEHFSQTFVVMARMAGIPARVVTGYQGGEKNPVDGFYSIYQSDAHAWSEVWLNGRGWTRVDPTAAVAGLRIDAGAAAALARPRGLPALIQLDSNWVRSLNYNWQAIQNAWNQWVLTYNPERQKSVLDKLGFDEPNWRNMAIALGIAMGTLMAIVSAALFLRRRTLDPLDAAWARVCRI